MKNAFKIGLLAINVSILASGCFGCGNGDKSSKLPGKDSDSVAKHIDTPAKVKPDSTKKDTTKK